jgi:hypothetical protein
MSESPTPKVAERSWRVRLIVMDGVLVALLGWLLYVVVANRGSAGTAAEEATPPVEQVPLEGTGAAPQVPADAPPAR